MAGRRHVVALLAFCAAGLLLVVGCSLIGLVIGAKVDSKHSVRYINGWELQSVKPGTRLEVIRKGGGPLDGKFTGMERVPAEVYAQRMRGDPSLARLPAPGDEIAVLDSSAVAHRGKFVGFDLEYRLNERNELSTAGRNETIEIIQDSTGLSVRIPLSDVDRIQDSQGIAIDGYELRGLANRRMLPVLLALGLQTARENTLIPLDDVSQITMRAHSHKGKLIGFFVGAMVDLAVIAIASSESSSSSPPPDSTASCPFLYSFDGESYVLDSEMYGGAIFEAAQRTDWDNLDHLREVGGSYRLRLMNELEETQFVDDLKLLVVDHPRGARVVPSFEGELHTLTALQPPIRATAQDGASVVELIRARDDQVWVSNPFDRNPDNEADGRDAVELEFSRPPATETVKLLFNVQNTWWASYLQGRILTLQGSEVGEWYELMNRSAAAREAWKQAMIREGMLLIKLWNGDEWEDAGYVWEVGPAVAKDVVAELNLRDNPCETLRIKLESTVGLWMINTVQADYSADLPVRVRELSADKATDRVGRDLRSVLAANDGTRYIMQTTGDCAEISFVAPPRSRDLSRSFVLKSAGYYTYRAVGGGESQTELFAQFLAEPGAFGRYTLRLLNEELAAASKDLVVR